MTEEKQQSNLSKSASHGSQNIEQLTYKQKESSHYTNGMIVVFLKIQSPTTQLKYYFFFNLKL